MNPKDYFKTFELNFVISDKQNLSDNEFVGKSFCAFPNLACMASIIINF
jgi:hypothetical protein